MSHICPECVAGKCGNCDGSAWDNEADEMVVCTHVHNVPAEVETFSQEYAEAAIEDATW